MVRRSNGLPLSCPVWMTELTVAQIEIVRIAQSANEKSRRRVRLLERAADRRNNDSVCRMAQLGMKQAASSAPLKELIRQFRGRPVAFLPHHARAAVCWAADAPKVEAAMLRLA